MKYDFGSLNLNRLTIDKQNVSQITSITTAVTLTAQAGIITTQSATTVADSITQFTVNHPDVNVNSVILLTLINYPGAGLPSVHVDEFTTGSFKINIQNHHPSAALNNVLKIAYFIL
jgi:hypothetical protein